MLVKRRTKPSARLRDIDNDSEFQLTSHRQARSHIESEVSGKAVASGSAEAPSQSTTASKRKTQRTTMIDVTEEDDDSSMCSHSFTGCTVSDFVSSFSKTAENRRGIG